MELWIRSQNKMKFRRVIDLGIFEEQEGYTIYCDDIVDSILGTYKTQKRALEILDEIQSILSPKIKIIHENDIKEKYEFVEPSTYVYQMPEE